MAFHLFDELLYKLHGRSFRMYYFILIIFILFAELIWYQVDLRASRLSQTAQITLCALDGAWRPPFAVAQLDYKFMPDLHIAYFSLDHFKWGSNK